MKHWSRIKILLWSAVGIVTTVAFVTPLAIILDKNYSRRVQVRVEEESYNPPKVEIPLELFPGIKQDPEEYDKLKNDPFVITINSSHHTIAKNNYVSFDFDEDVKQKLEAKGKSIPEWSTYFFKTFASSPAANLQEESGTRNINFEYPQGQAGAAALTGFGNVGIRVFYSTLEKGLGNLGFVIPKEYSQFEFGATFAKSFPLPNDNKGKEYAKAIYESFLNDLNDNTSKNAFAIAITFEADKIFASPWTSNPEVPYQKIANWTKDVSRNWKDFAAEINSYVPYQKDPFFNTNVALDESIVLETLGRIFASYSLQLENYVQIRGDITTDAIQKLTNMLHGYNIFDENKPKQSFEIVKSILHNEFDLSNKCGLSFSLLKHKDGSLFIDKVFFKSFGSAYTNDLKKVQIIDKATGNVLKEMPITHKNYPIGFSKNIFNDYEYKYIAPGAYAIDNVPKDWIPTIHKIGELDFKIIKNDGTELSKNDVMFQENVEKDLKSWPNEAYYLASDGQMHSTDEIYK